MLHCENIHLQPRDRRNSSAHSGEPVVVVPKHLVFQFTSDQTNKLWVPVITYTRTHKGWLCLAVTINISSKQVIGWSMGSRIDTSFLLHILLIAPWVRQPKNRYCACHFSLISFS
jgi:putative transposase